MKPDYLKAILGPGGPLTVALADGEEVMLRVDGVCMTPDIGHQASVRLERSPFFIPGDVVAFHCAHHRRLLMHRFLGYVPRRGAWKLMTMADRGTRPDPLVDPSAVLGRVIARNGRAYRIPPAKRLEAMGRYALWCARRLYDHYARRFAV